MHKGDIKKFTLRELEKALVEIDEPPYRAKQIFSWLYKDGVNDFTEMSNIPQRLKAKLDNKYYIGTLEISEHLESADGAEKAIFKLSDGYFIETVLIHTTYRKTLCLSTQVGCKFACAFCASGQHGFIRNLTAAEIINQILYFERNLEHKITNYVFMGMGEPLDNYENVTKAIIVMNEPQGMNIGARRITISTCGVIPGIEKLKDLGLQVNLSVSLHAVNDKLRDMLMPVNKKYPLKRLINALRNFVDKTDRIITLEYVLIKGVNDSIEDADGLAAIAKKLRAKVNLILYSEIPDFSFRPSPHGKAQIFMRQLAKNGIKATLRESKGKEINAACGQLAGKKKNEI